MKKLILILLIVFPLVSNAQDPLKFEEVIQVEGVSKDELFNRAKRWFNDVYKDSQKVLQLQDKESGEISGKAVFKYFSRVFIGSDNTKGTISYTVNIFVKDGRYKYQITDFVHEAYGSYSFGMITTDEEYPHKMTGTTRGWKNNVWRDLKENSTEEAKSLIPSLIEGMNKKSQNESDW